MVSVNVYQSEFTEDEWDAIERALITLLDVANASPRFVMGLSGDDLQEARRLVPHAESALLKVELRQHT